MTIMRASLKSKRRLDMVRVIMKISGFVISYNREDTIETCLRSLRFVDELLLIDKSSTDNTETIGRRFADRVIVRPWSPTVEGTRAFGLQACTFDNIVCLDDDECLSTAAIQYLNEELRRPSADVFALPCRQHILGCHDESAYYWPERHIKAFRRGAVSFNATVHGGVAVSPQATRAEPGFDSGISYHNISHADAFTWIEKTNRYTSQRDREVWVEVEPGEIFSEAQSRLDAWREASGASPSPYAQCVGLLRAIYDLTDIVKHWEENDGRDGRAMFAETCRQLGTDYDRLEADTGINTAAGIAADRDGAMATSRDSSIEGDRGERGAIGTSVDHDAVLAGLRQDVAEANQGRMALARDCETRDETIAGLRHDLAEADRGRAAFEGGCRERDAEITRLRLHVAELARPPAPGSGRSETALVAALRDQIARHEREIARLVRATGGATPAT